MIEPDGPAPYAPPATVMSVIQRHRQVAVPHFDVPTLTRIGVSESLAPRTLQSLKLLQLVTDEGAPTEEFERLRKSPSAEFEQELLAIIQNAYGAVFSIVDPTSAGVEQVEDAFRHFTPAGQRGRMVTLFLGLLREAGVEGPSDRQESTSRRGVVRPRQTTKKASVQPKSRAVDTEELNLPLPPVATPRLDNGDTYRVQLESGGSVSIVVDVDLFRLSIPDREFVLDLVDRMKGYEAARAVSS